MPAAQQAARLTDPVTHGWGMLGMLAGALLGAALLIGGVVTGGLLVAAVVMAGMALAGHQLAKGIERAFGLSGPEGGLLSPGSPNVRINQMPAQRAEVDGAAVCSGLPLNHFPMPAALIAEGAKTVRINSLLAAQVTNRLICGAQIKMGSPNVFIGGETEQKLPIDDIEAELVTGLGYVLIAAAVIGGGMIVAGAFAVGGVVAAFIAGATFVGELGLGYAGFELAGMAGDAIGPGWRDIFQGTLGIAAVLGSASKLRGVEERPCAGEPVDSVTGEVIASKTDFKLPGSLELVLKRCYASGLDYGSCFGPKWCSTWGQFIRPAGEAAVYFTDDGRSIPFELNSGEWVRNDKVNKIRLRATGYGFEVRDERFRTLGFHSEFEQKFLLTSIADRNGNSIQFEYGEDGALRKVVHSGGYTLLIDSTPTQIHRVRLAVADGSHIELIRYEYDENGCLSGVIDGSGLPFQYEYDVDARITRWKDRERTWYSYTYDSAGRCVEAIGPEGMYHYQFQYNEAARKNLITDSLGGVTTVVYNELLQISQRVDPLGGITATKWDARSNKLEETDPSGRKSIFQYDADGNVLNFVNPLGRKIEFVFSEFGLASQVTDAGGRRWIRSYDSRGNITEAGLAGNPLWNYEHDQRGNLVSVTDPVGNVRRFFHDSRGLTIWFTDWERNATNLKRDALGRVVAKTDPLGHRTEFRYNALGKISQATLATGTPVKWEYDAEGNLLRRIAPNGRVYSYRYSYFDLLAEVNKPAGGRIRLEYDSEGRLSSVDNELNETYRYEYDLIGRVTGEQDFSGRTLRFEYNPAGLCIRRVNGLGEETLFKHDGAGQVVRRTSPDDDAQFEYDASGLVTLAKNRAAEIRFERDEYGRVLRELQNDHVVESRYDARGVRTGRRLDTSSEVTFDSDGNGLLIGLGLPGEYLEFKRDAVGRNVERRSRAGFVLRQEYDPLHRLTAQWGAPETGMANPVVERHYRYDENDNPVEISDTRWGAESVDYDLNDRVIAASKTRGADEVFTYDAVGNIATTSVHVASAAGSASRLKLGFRIRFYSKGGRLLQDGDTRFTFDDDGRVIEKRSAGERWRYEWNSEGRLHSLRTPGGERWTYEYDAFGRRVLKSGPGVATAFVWDGAVIAEELAGGSASAAWVFEPGTFRPLAKQELGKVLSCVTDQIGTPREFIRGSGHLAASGHFSVWGREEVTDRGDAPGADPARFQGQWFDAESELHYNFHRYYDSNTGQYLSPDPIGLAGGSRSYAYVHNPFNWIDPFGLACSKNIFPENPNELTQQLGVEPKISTTPDGTTRMKWEPNPNTRIRYESHPEGLSEGDPGFNPRHHGEHYHVETRPQGTSWNQGKTKALPEGYTQGSGTGFLAGEKFPGT